ncbi:MAG: glucose-1-phosphate cytidylyltransferase [Rhodospirillales bacterium]|nr:glucose-1-phosphate cytidylyltransferase [Chloroflexota bacterium]MBS40292.1 glucose-1-phosphate cytidylyltransferase [Rhodospirillales bacterium]|tara:strand:- start:17674 stop:18441 length:768 start_codon:yes stop_codon:yes gene_type:complete
MKTIILAGGLGTRLSEETSVRPKPMVEIGDNPILWHILNIYGHYGHDDFYIALGYKGEQIKQYFINYNLFEDDITVNLKTGETDYVKQTRKNWVINLIETGKNTETGGRILKLKEHIGKETFLMTYGDGVANIDIDELIKFHKSHGKLATITAVRPPSRFGRLEFDGDSVISFSEKPQIGEGWINGGFFVLEPKIFDYIKDDATIFEREPLEKLAQDNQLQAFKHEGFWQPMDTLRELRLLKSMWDSGNAPWKIW